MSYLYICARIRVTGCQHTVFLLFTDRVSLLSISLTLYVELLATLSFVFAADSVDLCFGRFFLSVAVYASRYCSSNCVCSYNERCVCFYTSVRRLSARRWYPSIDAFSPLFQYPHFWPAVSGPATLAAVLEPAVGVPTHHPIVPVPAVLAAVPEPQLTHPPVDTVRPLFQYPPLSPGVPEPPTYCVYPLIILIVYVIVSGGILCCRLCRRYILLVPVIMAVILSSQLDGLQCV